MTDILKLGPGSFHPSNALTGNEDVTIYRGQNMLLRGEPGSHYFECFAGIKNLNEPIPAVTITGTLSFTAGNPNITGVGTLFKDELHIGQFIYAGEDVLVVNEITSNLLFRCDRPPYGTSAGVTANKMPILFEIDNQRGTMSWGNALKFDLGNIVCVGEGQLRLNGALLPGQSMIADRGVKLAIFDPATDQYTVERFGFTVQPRAVDCSITVVAGGTKNMTAGNYSFRWAWANKETAFGFSNPSEVIKLNASAAALAITATNQRFALDFTAAIVNKPSNADSIIIYRSFFATGSRSNPLSYAEGAWFVAKTVQIADLEAGDIAYVDVLDAELGTEVTFDNDPPPDAEWVSALAGDLVLLSCYGDKTVANPNGTSPGPMVVPQRRGNRDAFPTTTATPLSPPDVIIGFSASVGRIFLMTRTGLPFATSTGQADYPITTRPFWQTGFKGPFGLAFVNDTLYAFTSKGVTRSIATGDVGSEQHAWAAAAEDITRTWFAGHVHTVHDPANELVLFCYSASHRNAAGFWVSTVLPFSLRHQAFMPLIIIEKPNRDMVVCGIIKIDGHVQFIAGGKGVPEAAIELAATSAGTSTADAVIQIGSEVFAPPTAAIFCCGGECNVHGTNTHLLVEAGIEPVFDTTIVNFNSKRSILYGFGSARTILNVPTGRMFVNKFYFRIETLPDWSQHIVFSGTTNSDLLGLAYIHNTGRIYCAGGLWAASTVYGYKYFTFYPGTYNGTQTTGPEVIAGAGFAPTLGVWYRCDVKIDRNARTVDAIITEPNGTAHTLAQFSEQLHGYGQYPGYPDMAALDGQLKIGRHLMGNSFDVPAASNGIWRFDDILVSTTAADYPLGTGYIRAFKAVADGTHNITDPTDRFKKGPWAGSTPSDGTNITNATTDSYASFEYPFHINSLSTPFPNNGYIGAFAPNSPNDYVEYVLGPLPGDSPPLEGPRIVSPISCQHNIDHPLGADLTDVPKGTVILLDNTVQTVIADNPGNLLGSPNSVFEVKFLGNPPGSPSVPWHVGGNNQGDFNNLRFRLKSPGNAPSDGQEPVFWSGLIVEAEFPGEPPV